MKKLYFLGALVLSGSLLNAQSKLGLQKNEALQYTASGNHLKIKTESIDKISLAKRKAAAFWSEDFSNGFDGQGSNGAWTQSGTANSTTGIVPEWEYRGPNTTPDNTTGSRGSCVGTRGPITSNSVDNGFMIFDSNYWDEPLPDNCAGSGTGLSPRPHQSALISPSIDFSNQPEVQLFFTTYSRNFQAEMNISIIADGDTTFLVDLYSFLELGGNAQTLTDQLVGLDISALAGGKSDVKIMWNFEGDYYFFTMDDVFFDEIPDYDYNIVEVWNDDITDYYEYYHLPLSQSHVITPGINVNSRGTEPVDLEIIVNIEEPNGNIQGPFSQILTAFPKDSASGAIYIPTFKPTQLGVHTITYKVTTPNDANDLDTLNNTAVRRFEMTDDLWSDAFSEFIRFAFFAPQVDNAPGENETFQTFYTYEDVMVSGIDFLITNDDREPDAQTFEFDEVEVSVYTADKDLLAASIEAGTVLKSEVFTKETSTFLEVEEKHIGDPDNFIINTLAFEDVISVGKDNVFAISLYNSGGGYLTITSTGPNDNSDLSGITRARGLLATPSSATDDELFFFSNSNPYLRAHTAPDFNSIKESNKLNSNLSTAPNPSNKSTNISFTLRASNTATITVKDLLGKEVYTTTENFSTGRNNVELNTEVLQNGIYFYSVSVNGKTDTKKLVVQH